MTTSARRALPLFALLLLGCSADAGVQVTPDKARQALRTALDAWKAGRKIETLQQDSPPIVAQDFDWIAGATLTGYEVQGDGTAQGANLRVGVKLLLRDKRGQDATKTVNYVVGTDKTLTVFRAFD